METHDLKCWEEFWPLIQDIRNEYGWLKVTEDYSKRNVVLFRGHGDSEWLLKTTLERSTNRQFRIEDYLRSACRCASELESVTGNKWDIPSFPELQEELREKNDSVKPYLPCYEYMTYLRHHGFPSPLLDWTASPYIAAYFAYCDKNMGERVSVYAYIERPMGVKGGVGGAPQISLLGPYVRTDRRHFAQKSWYTIATKYDYDREEHLFYSHSSVFYFGPDNQDVLIKITIPASERIQALEELNDYNINHFTLFQTEDSLVKSLALKEFELNST